MKKIMMALALIASMFACASVDVYEFKSTMNVYSNSKHKYVSTKFNGTLTVDTEDGTAVLAATKKDTKESFELELTEGGSAPTTIVTTNSVATIEKVPTEVVDPDTGVTNIVDVVTTNVVDTVVTNTIPGVEGGMLFAIVTGKKDGVGAAYMSSFESESLTLQLAGSGVAKTVTVGCGPCGDTSSCTKIKTMKGSMIGAYDCQCGCGQHYVYDGSCELPEAKETNVCPVYGTWTATLKTVDGAKYK